MNASVPPEPTATRLVAGWLPTAQPTGGTQEPVKVLATGAHPVEPEKVALVFGPTLPEGPVPPVAVPPGTKKVVEAVRRTGFQRSFRHRQAVHARTRGPTAV